MTDVKEFSISSNGDRWSLEVVDGDMSVLHKANEASGGHETRAPFGAFLEERVGRPEHTALLQVLGQSSDEAKNRSKSEEVETPSLRIATEYLRLGGRRRAKVDDNIVSSRSWENAPSAAEAFGREHVAHLPEKEQRDIIIHLPSISDR